MITQDVIDDIIAKIDEAQGADSINPGSLSILLQSIASLGASAGRGKYPLTEETDSSDFIVGSGTNTSPKDGLIMKGHVLTMPSATPAEMWNLGPFSLVTKNYLDTITKPYDFHTSHVSSNGTSISDNIVQNSFDEYPTWTEVAPGNYRLIFELSNFPIGETFITVSNLHGVAVQMERESNNSFILKLTDLATNDTVAMDSRRINYEIRRYKLNYHKYLVEGGLSDGGK